MKALVAALALVALAIFAAPAEARGVSRSRQVVRGHHAQAQVICAAPQQVILAQPQAQVLYPAPQQVFLPQTQVVYAQPQQQVVIAPQPQVVYQQAQAQVVLPQAVAAYPQPLIGAQLKAGGGVFNGRQVVKTKNVVRGNVAAAPAVILPY